MTDDFPAWVYDIYAAAHGCRSDAVSTHDAGLTEMMVVVGRHVADLAADRDRARDVAVALEQELAEVRAAFREVLDLHEQPAREDVEGVYPWFSGDIGVDEMAGYQALLGDGS